MMRALLMFALLAAPGAFAQSINITFNAPPPLVVVQPGVQVVEDHDEEVYVVQDAYWVRRGPRWYRASDYRGGWVVVDAPPPALVKLPPGKYKHYRGAVVVKPGKPPKEHRRH